MSRLERLIRAARRPDGTARTIRLIERLSALDRFQASDAINVAAREVASRATDAGLAQVQVHSFGTNATWWTFAPPASWSPVSGALHVEGALEPIVSYPADRCCLATNSCATPESGWQGTLRRWSPSATDLLGAMAWIPADASLPTAIQHLEASGAVGFVTANASTRAGAIVPGAIGRVELRPGARLWGFSVPISDASRLEAAARRHATVSVEIRLTRGAAMPVVTAALPGPADGEIWLTAHLCHVGPAACDNTAGVATLLAVAERLAQRPASAFRKGIRFVWMPEMVGTAAYLHCAAAEGRPMPSVVLDVDTVGGAPDAASGPLCVERTPSHLPSALPALVGRALSVAAELESDAEVLPVEHVPFMGMSDHMLYADRSIAVPAVCFGQHRDELKHSSADDAGRLRAPELERVIAAVTGLTEFVASLCADDRDEVGAVVLDWASRLTEARAYRPGSALDEYLHCCLAEVDALAPGHEPSWSRRWAARPPRLGGAAPGSDIVRVVRRWDGPFNLYGLLASNLPANDREWFAGEFSRHRWLYSVCLALALAIDDKRGPDEIVDQSRVDTPFPVHEAFAFRFLDMLRAAGWTEERAMEARC